MTVLVDVDRDRRAPLQLRAARIAGGEGLLAVLEHRQLRQVVEGFLQRPRLVHVALERQVGDRANGTDAVDVEAVAAAELQLEALEAAVGDPLRAARHVVRVAEPNRPRRRRPGPTQSEQLVDGLSRELALEVVQRVIDGCAGCLLARRQTFRELVERERIVAQLDAPQPCEGARSRLGVALDRRRLAEARETLVLHFDLNDVGCVLRPARDGEGLREPNRRDTSREFHGATLVPQRARSSGDRAFASGIWSYVGSSGRQY